MSFWQFKTRRLWHLLGILATLTIFIGLIITPVEKQFGRLTTFQTTSDGLWWAVTTITSVGYGDYYPVTNPGRILGALLEVAGVMTFGVIVALVTIELFRSERMFYWKRTTERFDRIEHTLNKLEKNLGYDTKLKVKNESATTQMLNDKQYLKTQNSNLKTTSQNRKSSGETI